MSSERTLDLSPAGLARANRGNLLAFFRYMCQSEQAVVQQTDGVYACHTRVPHPWFNVAISERPAAGDERAAISSVLEFFSQHNVRTFSWWLDLAADGSSWENRLVEAGLKPDANTPGMALHLAHLPDSPPPLPDGLRITAVEDLAGLRTWTQIFMTGYGVPLAWEEDFFALLAGMGFALPVRSYTGWLDGQPAATATLFLGAGVAGIYNVATLPEARGRRLGSALTLAPLYEARAMGYTAATLQSSSMGLGVYRRLGFQEVLRMTHHTYQQA